MGLLHPELLLLLGPALWVWWITLPRDRGVAALRLTALLLLVACLAGPYLDLARPGHDVLVLVDRSRSMPSDSGERALELIQLVSRELRTGDRLGVIGFGADARVELVPTGEPGFTRFELDPRADGSDLGGALETALQLVARGRSGRILIVSDGENNGRDPIPLARRAFACGTRIDVRTTTRQGHNDIAVERLDLPEQVGEGEPFQFSAWVHSDSDTQSEVVLERDGRVLSAGLRSLRRGSNRLVFRDIASAAGVAEYHLAVGADADRDRVPENNRAIGATAVTGQPAVLVLNDDGRDDVVATALSRAGIRTQTARPEDLRLDAVSLSHYRAVILENVAATRLGRGTAALAAFVTERGGGLLLTGGRASFGVGGYYRSDLDELLPVSLEMRQEQRKLGVAIAVVLDRSGSMGMPVAGGLRKMDLANQGAAAAIDLLSPIDAIGVIAVDSEPHSVVPMQPVTDRSAIASRVLRIESMGGGIFVRTGLVAAAHALDSSDRQNRHIILFADAADAEEQEGCDTLVDGLAAAGVTLSVIALGSEADTDAAFLKDIARRGSGNAWFTTSPAELPRLFAQDTLLSARASFISDPTGTAVLSGLLGLGSDVTRSFPSVDGYNLTWLRSGATAGVVTTDQYQAPILAFHHKGLGRVAALCAQIGGEYGVSLLGFEALPAFLVTLARFLIGTEEPDTFFTAVRREGLDAVLSVEVDPSEAALADTSRLLARIQLADGEIREVPLLRAAEQRFEARTRLPDQGIAVGTVRLDDDRFISLPPLLLPQSPEFERSADPQRGARLLQRIADEGGGSELSSVKALLAGDRSGRGRRPVGRPLALLVLLVLLLEIASRRLQWFAWLHRPQRAATTPAVGAAQESADVETATTAAVTADRAAPTASPPQPEGMPPAAPAAPPPPSDDLGSALDRARRSAKRRLGG